MQAKKAIYAAGAVLFLAAACGIALFAVYVPPPADPITIGPNQRPPWDILSVVMMVLGVASVCCWVSSIGIVIERSDDGDDGGDDPQPAPDPDPAAAQSIPLDDVELEVRRWQQVGERS